MKALRSKLGVTELACLGQKVTPSRFGRTVAEILAVVFRGLHHVDPAQLKKVNWADETIIAIDFRNAQFATADYNELTQLVVIAHDACVRVSIASPAMKTLRLTFHPREREGSYSRRHPTLEEHAMQIRSNYEFPPV